MSWAWSRCRRTCTRSCCFCCGSCSCGTACRSWGTSVAFWYANVDFVICIAACRAAEFCCMIRRHASQRTDIVIHMMHHYWYTCWLCIMYASCVRISMVFPQAGQLYIRGHLDWSKLSAATLQRVESAWPFNRVYQWDSFIASTSQLPTSYTAAPLAGGVDLRCGTKNPVASSIKTTRQRVPCYTARPQQRRCTGCIRRCPVRHNTYQCPQRRPQRSTRRFQGCHTCLVVLLVVGKTSRVGWQSHKTLNQNSLYIVNKPIVLL